MKWNVLFEIMENCSKIPKNTRIKFNAIQCSFERINDISERN